MSLPDWTQKLVAITELYNDGQLTASEFEFAKAKVMGMSTVAKPTNGLFLGLSGLLGLLKTISI